MKLQPAAWLLLGLGIGIGVSAWHARREPKIALAASNDRYEEFVISTGHVANTRNGQTEGVWLLDSRSGKLLASMIDRVLGRIAGWAELDLIQDFGFPAKQNVHFVMTTGAINNGQSALYVAETNSGRLAVYTMGVRPDGQPGMSIRRHDMTAFRAQQ